ncbi:MAG: hypothetical protein AMDU1_APLC00008G0007 [Thermoplasmatales archaeon A-plasma]|jgi:hypothetical protein|nr:MAG: hypothetical protein AMDU1_APLC00008G0007 [Thermoplasmatales archaeon A-plasma]
MDSEPQADLTRIPIGATLYQQYLAVQEEFTKSLRISGKDSLWNYTGMRTLWGMTEAQGARYPEIVGKYLTQWDELNSKYGDPEEREWMFSSQEAVARKRILEYMLVDLGITRMDSRPQPPEIERYEFGYRYDGRQLIYSYWKKRKSENRNLNIIFTGKVGGGKSYAGLSTGNYLNKNYDLNNVTFEISDFISRVQTQPKGSVIVLDEGGVAAGNKDTMTIASKSLSKTIQSTRYLQLITIYNVPNLNFIDRAVRLMCDLIFDHEADMRQGEFTVSVPELSEDGKEIELTPLRMDGKIIQSVYFPLPPPYLVQDYEVRRKEHNMKQLEDLKGKLAPKQKKEYEPEEDRRGKNPNSLKNLKPFRKDYSDGEGVEVVDG